MEVVNIGTLVCSKWKVPTLSSYALIQCTTNFSKHILCFKGFNKKSGRIQRVIAIWRLVIFMSRKLKEHMAEH